MIIWRVRRSDKEEKIANCLLTSLVIFYQQQIFHSFRREGEGPGLSFIYSNWVSDARIVENIFEEIPFVRGQFECLVAR